MKTALLIRSHASLYGTILFLIISINLNSQVHKRKHMFEIAATGDYMYSSAGLQTCNFTGGGASFLYAFKGIGAGFGYEYSLVGSATPASAVYLQLLGGFQQHKMRFELGTYGTDWSFSLGGKNNYSQGNSWNLQYGYQLNNYLSPIMEFGMDRGQNIASYSDQTYGWTIGIGGSDRTYTWTSKTTWTNVGLKAHAESESGWFAEAKAVFGIDHVNYDFSKQGNLTAQDVYWYQNEYENKPREPKIGFNARFEVKGGVRLGKVVRRK